MGSHTTASGDGRGQAELEARTILDSIRGIVQVLRESSRAAEERVGLSGAQLFVLQKLGEGGGASLNELAARTRTHQSSVSVVVSGWSSAGWCAAPLRGGRAPAGAGAHPRGPRRCLRAPDAAQER